MGADGKLENLRRVVIGMFSEIIIRRIYRRESMKGTRTISEKF